MSTQPGWSFAALVEAVARTVPDSPAVIEQDGSTVSWSELDRRADRIATALLSRELSNQSVLAVFMRNSSAFLEAYYGAFKASLVPANINYRYGAEETVHLLKDADAAAVIYHAEFRPVIEAARADDEVRVGIWIEVPDGTPGEPPSWATAYADVLASTEPTQLGPRTGDDVLLLYTGGTTGLPKGVIWRQADLFEVLVGRGNPFRGIPVPSSVEQLMSAIATPGPVDMAACPYMHATGLFNQLMTMIAGGTSVVVPSPSFDPIVLLDTAERHRVTLMVIVGDTMARPLAEALTAHPDRWDLSALETIVSSGATFSRATKEVLLEHLHHISILDAFGSSEASGAGTSISRRGQIADTAQFTLGERVRLIGSDGTFLERGVPGEGIVALSGVLPVGYHKDPEKTAATFRVIDGVRYAIPGDLAQVDADGQLKLLGRGSSCINSGGEKIYPEEVDEVVKRHPAIADAASVGVPDDRFGQAVATIVELRPEAVLTLEELRAFVKQHLAGYKAPRHLVPVDRLLRSPSGKLDHRWMGAVAEAALQGPA